MRFCKSIWITLQCFSWIVQTIVVTVCTPLASIACMICKKGEKMGGGSKKGGSHTQRQKIHIVGTRTYKPSSFLPYFVSYIILIAYISLLENWGHICAYFIIYEYENSLIIGGKKKRRDVHPQKVGVLVTHLKILTRIYTKRISGTSISITLNVYTGF